MGSGRLKTTFSRLLWSIEFWFGSCQCKALVQTWKAERRRAIHSPLPVWDDPMNIQWTWCLQWLAGELPETLTSVWHMRWNHEVRSLVGASCDSSIFWFQSQHWFSLTLTPLPNIKNFCINFLSANIPGVALFICLNSDWYTLLYTT